MNRKKGEKGETPGEGHASAEGGGGSMESGGAKY